MNCIEHPEIPSSATCKGCAEPFCENCLVIIKGEPYCSECKVMATGSGDGAVRPRPAVPPRPPAAPSADAMIQFRCPVTQKLLGMKPAMAGRTITCPACSESHTIPAVTTPPKPTPPAGPAAAGTVRTAVCVVHPTINAVGRCGGCRRSICHTCAFRSGPRIFCPECASKSNPAGSEIARKRGIASLILGIASFLLPILMVIIAAMMLAGGDPPDGNSDVFGCLGCVFLLSPVISLVGLILGLVSRDKRGWNGFGIAGTIINGLSLLFALFIILLGLAAAGAGK